MSKFQSVLFVLKRSYICYNLMYMTVLLKSIIKKNKIHSKKVLLAKSKLNSIELLNPYKKCYLIVCRLEKIQKLKIGRFFTPPPPPPPALQKRGKAMLLSKSAMYCSKKSRFLKKQEASRLVFGHNSLFNKTLILGTIF